MSNNRDKCYAMARRYFDIKQAPPAVLNANMAKLEAMDDVALLSFMDDVARRIRRIKTTGREEFNG